MLEEESELTPVLQAFCGSMLRSVVVCTGEIFLEFEQPSGPWSLGTGGSMWALVHHDEPVIEYQDDEHQIERFNVAIGRHVVGVYPGENASGLQVDLEDDMAFYIMRSAEGVAPDLPVFELSTPQHRLVLLHRNGVIDDVPSDVPIRDLVASGSLHHWPSDAD